MLDRVFEPANKHNAAPCACLLAWGLHQLRVVLYSQLKVTWAVGETKGTAQVTAESDDLDELQVAELEVTAGKGTPGEADARRVVQERLPDSLRPHLQQLLSELQAK
jgi:hypothetical protein